MAREITLSVIKADIGGWVGHSSVHPEVSAVAEGRLEEAISSGLVLDARRGRVGDDTALIMTHEKGIDDEAIHEFSWDTFITMTEKARQLGQYGAGQDLLSDSFSGNVRGMGPGCAEMTFEVRPSEPVIIFLADKTEPGAWNLPLYKMFADPFNTIGLVIDPNMHGGFLFEVHDLMEHKKVTFKTPEEIYDLLVFIGAPARYVIKYVYRASDGVVAAATSTQRLSLIAGRYVGKDDPVMIVRSQSGLPAVGEVVEPFSLAHTVAGWMRGSHHGPLMPVSWDNDTPTRFDGPPRVVGYGFQITTDGKLGEPRDMLGDVSFDNARRRALQAADYLRMHGPFEPHRLSLDEMEYTTMPQVQERLAERFEDVPEGSC
ncbi:MAG: fructose-1,6-bisphosphate aldolase/phosphatase [Coriobacteriia bacterium]|nr:fructose-1,6-bisphosphate aldolase/phosphatase [Coriobacteriia bacterium]